MVIGLMPVLTGKREKALLPSIIHRGQCCFCFSTSGKADVSGRGLGVGCVSFSMVNCSLISLNPYFYGHLNALFRQTPLCHSFIQSQVSVWGSYLKN